MEQVEVLGATGAFGFGVDAPQQIGIALGVEHDDHITAAMGNQNSASRVLPTRVVPSTGMADTLTEIHPHIFLLRFPPHAAPSARPPAAT